MTHLGADMAAVRTERWRYITYPEGDQLYDHDKDPLEWENLAGRPEHAKVLGDLAAMLPENPSRKKVMSYRDLPEEKRRLAPLGPNRHHKSDPDNYVGLLPSPPGN